MQEGYVNLSLNQGRPDIHSANSHHILTGLAAGVGASVAERYPGRSRIMHVWDIDGVSTAHQGSGSSCTLESTPSGRRCINWSLHRRDTASRSSECPAPRLQRLDRCMTVIVLRFVQDPPRSEEKRIARRGRIEKLPAQPVPQWDDRLRRGRLLTTALRALFQVDRQQDRSGKLTS